MTITKGSRSRRAALLLTAAVAVTGAVQVAAAGPASASCSISRFTVVWSQAGIYDIGTNLLIGTKNYGDIVEGPTGSTFGGWTYVYRYNNVINKMKPDSLSYRGCY